MYVIINILFRTAVLFTRKAQAALKRPLEAITTSSVKMEHHNHHHNSLDNKSNNSIGGNNSTNTIGGSGGIMVTTNINSSTMTAIAAAGLSATTNLSTTPINTLTASNLTISGAGSASVMGISGTLIVSGTQSSGHGQGQGVLMSNLGAMNSSSLVIPPLSSISANKYNSNATNVNNVLLSNQLTALTSMVIGVNVGSNSGGGSGSVVGCGKSPKRSNARYKRQMGEMRNNDNLMVSGPLSSPKKSPTCTSILSNTMNAINNNSNPGVSSLSPTCYQLPMVLSSSASTTSTASTLPIALSKSAAIASGVLPASPNTNLHTASGLNNFNHIPDKFRVYRTNDRDVSESDSDDHSHISGGSPCSSCSGFGLSCTGSELNSSDEDEDDDDEEDDEDDDDDEEDDDDEGEDDEEDNEDEDYNHENEGDKEDDENGPVHIRHRNSTRKTREFNNYETRLTAMNVQKAMINLDAAENVTRNNRAISCSVDSESQPMISRTSIASTTTSPANVSSLKRPRGRQRKRKSPILRTSPMTTTPSIIQKNHKTTAITNNQTFQGSTIGTGTATSLSNNSSRYRNNRNISPAVNSNHQRIASTNNLNNNIRTRKRSENTANINSNSNSNNINSNLISNNNSIDHHKMNKGNNSGSDDNNATIQQMLNNSGGATQSSSCSGSSGISMDAMMKPSLEPLQLVWAKCRGYPWYPALILDPKTPKGFVYNGVPLPAPPTDVLALRKNYPIDLDVYLVLFFDVKRTWQWLPANKLELLGVDKEVDQQKLIESRKPTDRKAVKKAYQDALHYQSQVTDLEGQGPDPIM